MDSSIMNILVDKYLFNEEYGFSRDEIRVLRESPEKEKEVVDRTITEIFKATKRKAFNFDYRNIEVSRGDITKLPQYSDIYNAINFLIKAANQTTSADLIKVVNNIATCRDNIVSNKTGFTKGFSSKNNVVIMLYNNIVTCLIYSVSLVITKTITIVKDSYGVPLRKMETNNVNDIINSSMYRSLLQFNELCRKGQLNILFKDDIRERVNDTVYNESFTIPAPLLSIIQKALKSAKDNKVVAGISIAVVVLAVVIAVCQNIVYWITCLRLKLALTLEQIALYNEIEASKTDNKEKKEELEKKAEKLRKISEKLDVDGEVAEKRKKSEEERDAREIANNIKNNSSQKSDNSSSNSSGSSTIDLY